MTIRHYADIGSVSTGTLRTEDLLEAFASELEDHVRANKRRHGLGLPAKRRLIREAYAIDPESDEADDVLADLQEALNDFAPHAGRRRRGFRLLARAGRWRGR